MTNHYRLSVLLVVLLASVVAYPQKTDAPEAAAKKAAAKKAETKKSEAPLPMMTYQVVFFKAGPAKTQATAPAKSPSAEEAKAAKMKGAQAQGTMMQGHLANLARLNNERANLIYGPFTDTNPQTATMNELRGVAILDVPDAETAKKYFAEDPFVTSGQMVLEVKPWLGPKGWFSAPIVPPGDDSAKMAMEPLIFGILVRGPAAKASPPVHTMEQRQEFQKGHLAYMGELHKQGKLVMAGPFMEDGDWRGVVVYRVASVADAQALAANDPAVKAGRLAIEARSWMTLKGILQ